MSLARELRAIATATGRALGVRVALTMFFAGLCAGSSFLLIPIPIAIAFLGGAAGFAGGRELGNDYERMFGAGALAAMGLLPFLGSLLIGATFLGSFHEAPYDAPSPQIQVAAVAVQVAAAALGTMAFSPVLAAAELRSCAAETISEALARSIAIASRRPLATMLTGAMQGVLFSLPVVAFVFTRVPTSLVLALVGCCIAWTLYPAVGRGLATPSTSAPRALGWLLVPSALAWIGLLAICVAVSSPLHERWPRPPVDHAARMDITVERRGPHDMELTTPLGAMRLRSHEWLEGQGTTWVDEATGHVIVCAQAFHAECIGTELDASYHRVDDDLLGRWRARIDVTHLALLAAALVALVWATRRARTAARSVRPGLGTRVVLRLGPNGTRMVEDERLVLGGDVHLESLDGDRIVTIDRALSIVLGDRPWDDGAELWLVNAAPIEGLGPRVGASSASEGAWLAAGLDGTSARVLHVARASALLATIGTLLALLGAALPLLSL